MSEEGIVTNEESNQKLYTCWLCGKRFINRFALAGHIGRAHKRPVYVCKICNMRFKNLHTLMDHMMTNHSSLSEQIQSILEQAISIEPIDRHLMDSHKVYVCKICNMRFKNLHTLAEHMDTAHDSYLSYLIAQIISQVTSIQYEGSHKVYVCKICNMRFVNSSAIIDHMITVHRSYISHNLPQIFSVEIEHEDNYKIENKNNVIQTSNVNISVKEDKSLPMEETSVDKNVEELMKKFIERDPKIGIWSYPSYLLLQYLYNTIPGFKMSEVAKNALEKGLREMYPDLFKTAEKVTREAKKISTSDSKR